MNTYEIHPGEGGQDATAFAGELSEAIARSFRDAAIETSGRIIKVTTTTSL